MNNLQNCYHPFASRHLKHDQLIMCNVKSQKRSTLKGDDSALLVYLLISLWLHITYSYSWCPAGRLDDTAVASFEEPGLANQHVMYTVQIWIAAVYWTAIQIVKSEQHQYTHDRGRTPLLGWKM